MEIKTSPSIRVNEEIATIIERGLLFSWPISISMSVVIKKVKIIKDHLIIPWLTNSEKLVLSPNIEARETKEKATNKLNTLISHI